ncbi:glycosyltransferase family 39 protein [Rubritalea sp.]|uniref:glycosyltransferase family 39 protein n=1 Tax=Rubritalea sp. TaxID=2109375 RepID=UPI003EF501CC
MKSLANLQRGKLKPIVWAFVALLLTLIFLTGNYGPKARLSTYEATEGAEWISCSDESQYTGCFRYDLDLESEVRNGWIGVVSDGGFELHCNGNPVGAQTYWRPTRVFQNGLTEPGQRVVGQEPMVAYNFPREYQWSGHNNTQLVTLFDLRPYLKKGKNCISIEVEGRTIRPEVIAFGSILTKDGKNTAIKTNSEWYAEPIPIGLGQNSWTMPLYTVSHWQKAIVGQQQKTSFASTVPNGIYEKPFYGKWIVKDDRVGDTRYLAEIDIDDPTSGHIRIASFGDFWIWVNGQRLEGKGLQSSYNGGEWKVQWTGRRPLATPAVMLDPDEVGSFYAGYRYEDPRHGDPTKNDFKRFENTQNRTRERPNQTGGDLTGDGDEEKGREQDPYGFYEEADGAKPLTLKRKGFSAQFHAYDIGGLLRSGRNTIEVKLVENVSPGYKGSQPMKFCMDGECQSQDGSLYAFNDLAWFDDAGEPVKLGYQVQPDELPLLEFYKGNEVGIAWWTKALSVLGALFLATALVYRFPYLGKMSVIFSAVLGLAAILAFSMAERSEYLWFLLANRGPLLVGICALTSVLVLSCGKRWKGQLKADSHSTLWLVGLLCLVFMSRAWMVHYQPIDDDEYASIQAMLAIAETGAPHLSEDIWYSRSPLYHYMAAGVVKVFGPHIWSLRLYSVVLAVFTAWVMWRICIRYFSERWVACASVLIFALHPFLIFSGHIARFYQQQQFMVLLMIYLFIEGFILRKGMWFRVWAIILFTCAVLSQEISITFVPVFLVAYLLFGRGVPFRWDIKSLLYIAFAGVLIAADILLFKVKCITESVGVSPNLEATIAPTFWELGNLGSMFIGYSRLHIVLGLFYIGSFIYSLRRGSSVVITLHVFLIVSVVFFNLLITSVSFRYMYCVIPLWIILGAHGILVMSKWVAAQSYQSTAGSLKWVILLVVLASMSPWRIPGSYSEKILGDPISSLAYVRAQIREEDKVMITEPHPHAALLELGRADYDLVVPILYDFTYRSEGILKDRNGGAVVVNRLADLQKIFANDERVWIILNREKFRSRKKNIRWEYPGAREELFIRQNCALKYRSYLWAVYLWDQSSGEFDTFRKEPDGWSE